MDTVRIFDTTLRDGEQSPGATLTLPEKVEIARHLEAMGVDIIEAGFPISSDGDFESVRAIAARDHRIASSAGWRAARRRTSSAPAKRSKTPPSRASTSFCATSKIHREHKLKKGKEEIIKLGVESIKQALRVHEATSSSRPKTPAARSWISWKRSSQAAIEAGATTINMPDTVGYATPKSYGEIFSHLLKKLPNIDERGIILSSHCHNDLGLAVANSLAAVENGARQVECTINGIGERAGNAALEEIVMALASTRSDHYKIGTRIDATKIYPASRMVSTLTGLIVQRNKAIVGENAFAHEAGIHQDGVLKIPRDLRDHGPGHRRHRQELTGPGQTLAAGTRSATA